MRKMNVQIRAYTHACIIPRMHNDAKECGGHIANKQ